MAFKPPQHELDQIDRRIAADFAAEHLCRYDDWLQHDGLHFEKGKLTIHDLFQIVGTGQSVFEATPQDDDVCVGIAPLDYEWYLRFRAARGQRYRGPV